MLRLLYYHVVRSLRDEVTLVGQGCVMYTLSIVTKFHTEPHYPLGGSELSAFIPRSFAIWSPFGSRVFILDRSEGLAFSWLFILVSLPFQLY